MLLFSIQCLFNPLIFISTKTSLLGVIFVVMYYNRFVSHCSFNRKNNAIIFQNIYYCLCAYTNRCWQITLISSRKDHLINRIFDSEQLIYMSSITRLTHAFKSLFLAIFAYFRKFIVFSKIIKNGQSFSKTLLISSKIST